MLLWSLAADHVCVHELESCGQVTDKLASADIGTSLTIRNDNQEQNIIKSEFGSITPENAMKWDATEPNRGQFSFGGADQVANWATQNGKQMRCHTLVWYSQLPNWVNQINNNATLMSVMENHINSVMGRYKGKCTHWDVVNEYG